MMKNLKQRVCWLALSLTLCGQSQAQDLKLSANNIDQIVAAMTLEEKAHLLVGGDNYDRNGKKIDPVEGVAGYTHAIPRLGIPATVLTDGPAGVRIASHRKGTDQTFYGTGFPVGVALASTWNTDLVERVGRCIGNEALEYGCDILLAPALNIQRTPLCGRNYEYYSEDPVVAGAIATAYVKGVQSQGVGTSVKHFAANCQETNRINVDEVMSQRALREIYLRGFEQVVKEAKPWTVMSSYNKINGTWTQSSHDLLTTILRQEWGFGGYVVTDWTNEHRTSWDRVAAGNALLSPGHDWQEADLIENVKSGNLPMQTVDEQVGYLLRQIVRTPSFKRYAYSNKPDLKQHAEVTRQTSTEGMVLLKNADHALPLKPAQTVALFGVTSYSFIAGGSGSGDVNKPYVVDLKTGLTNAGYALAPELVDYYESYKAQELAARKARGNNSTDNFTEAVVDKAIIDRQADRSDVALFTLGRQAGEGNDRRIDGDYNLTDAEQRMLRDVAYAFHARGKKLVVILNMGNAIETASWKALPDAILLAWQPGQEGGNSVSDVLTGKESPSGRLPMTFMNSIDDCPATLNFPTGPGYDHGDSHRNRDYTIHEEGVYVGYRYFLTRGKGVSYPFGYGLSYTTFTYSAPTVSKTKDGFKATVKVTNTGKVAGKEVVELYVSAPLGSLRNKPVRELKAFAKTRKLQPGESQTVVMEVSDYALASFDDSNSHWEAARGQYRVQFAASSEDIKAQKTYTLAKTKAWKVNNVMVPNEKYKLNHLHSIPQVNGEAETPAGLQHVVGVK